VFRVQCSVFRVVGEEGFEGFEGFESLKSLKGWGSVPCSALWDRRLLQVIDFSDGYFSIDSSFSWR